jgi:hypothetical protein
MLIHMLETFVGKQTSIAAFFMVVVCLVATPVAWSAEPSDIKLGRDGSKVEVIRRALESITEAEFVETPMTCAIAFLEARHGIGIQMDTKALTDDNVPLDTPITKRFKDITLRSALKLILRDLDLRYVIQDEVIMITTIGVAGWTLETRVYLVRDLLPRTAQADGGNMVDYQSLIEAMMIANPQEVADGRQPGAIRAVPSAASIVVTQTQDTQEKIQELLAALRKSREQFKQ